MTVTFKEEISESRRARNTAGSRSYTRAFRLETSLQSEDAYDVGSHASLPVIGDLFPSDSNAYCHDIQIDNSDPWKGWIATYEYSDKRQVTPAATAGTGVIDEITYEFSSQIYQDVIERAWRDGWSTIFAPTNSAGTSYPEAITGDFASLIIKVQFNMTAVPEHALSYLNTLNDSAISINGLDIPKHSAKFQGVTVGRRETRGVYATGPLAGTVITYYPVTYEIHARPSGWKVRKKDEGFLEKITGKESDRKQVLDDLGEPVMQAYPLDGMGKRLANPSEDNIEYRTYRIYPEKNFSLLIGVD